MVARFGYAPCASALANGETLTLCQVSPTAFMHEHVSSLTDHHVHYINMSVPCHWHQDVLTLYDTCTDYGEDLRHNLDELSPNVRYEYRPEQIVNVNTHNTSLANLLLQIMGMIFLISGSESCRRKRITNRLRDCEFKEASNSWRYKNFGKSTITDG